MFTLPTGFLAHKNVQSLYSHRANSVDSGESIDWGTAETLTFGSLIQDGYRVRLSGQDVERGTFSHRHAVVHDQVTGRTHTPLTHVSTLDQSASAHRRFVASNSHLSSMAVLAYEYGYSLANPNTLTIWEAQYGDFANGAMPVYDQYLSSSESKWGVTSGLVTLLPHGLEGESPDHSSARVERFLQMCDDDPTHIPDFEANYYNRNQKAYNWQLVNCSTPANYFHALRRQM